MPSILVMFAAASVATAAPVTMIGVLEEPQCAEPAVAAAVRPLFARSEGRWTTLDDNAVALQGPVDWTAALDGRAHGIAKTTGATIAAPGTRIYSVQAPVPEVGNRQQRFAGWCSTPARRPLAASSVAQVADPDLWKPWAPDDALRQRLFAPFSAAAGPAMSCAGGEPAEKPYAASELVFGGGYQDRLGRRIVSVMLDPARNDCDGPAEGPLLAHWFVVGDDISAIGTELSLVEAADFDADGHSELLFWHSCYNNDGYVLLDSTLKLRSEQLWSYH